MATATVPSAPPIPLTRTLVDVVNYVRPGQRVLVTDVKWEDYEHLLAWRDEHRPRSVRLAYDQGRLEIMVVTNLHERLRRVLDLMLIIWITETGGEYLPSGQLTHKRDDLEKGFEPDECYYIQSWKRVAGLREIDFTTDPPPDLMIEVEVSRSVLSRLPIIAAFKVPEVWRYDGEKVAILLLQPDGSYAESQSSRAVPNFPFSEVAKYLAMAESSGESFASIDRQFRAWIKSLPAGTPTTPTN
jgi:Uma2 family endonuclease